MPGLGGTFETAVLGTGFASVRFGHSGAVKPDLQGRGFSTYEGEYGFHKQLETAFEEMHKHY